MGNSSYFLIVKGTVGDEQIMCKESEIIIPDSIRPYLNEIAERLWNGRAAVMVGAGFSKNADNSFPDWNQMGDLFYQKAYGGKPDSTRQKYLNVLRLAEEVHASIGRPALENLIRTNIPDMNIEPSRLHVNLLKLPWVDVFTTNYDTLLERASTKVINRRYEPVVNKEDIPYANKPRIVKLHGSFPSERPYIITEEDYRRYPHVNAPFVNTVQQSLLENTFCLIGFSGDDPNFLQWIGWIGDNLGRDKTQKIYLVGVFDLSSAKLQLLAQRGIIVVDLSCCHGIEKHDHKKALDKFFKYIVSKKPDALDWPYTSKTKHPSHSADQIKDVQKITEEWRKQRQVYPGWLILPSSNRENLWWNTKDWINYLPDTDNLPPGMDIQFAFELIWRLERCLLPIFGNIAESCEKLLDKYWPFKTENPPANYPYIAGEERFQDLPWNAIRQAWLAIALAMLRFYREEWYLDKWKEAENRLKTLSEHLSAEQGEFLNYEGFLFTLFTMDIPNAKQSLEKWRPDESQPYWMTKRAAALAELGILHDIYDQIQVSLVETRKKCNINTSSPDYQTVSNEAYQMLLMRYVGDASKWFLDNPATYEEEQLIKENLANEWKLGKQKPEPEPQVNNTIKPQEEIGSFDEDWDDLFDKRLNSRSTEWSQRLKDIRLNQRQTELQQQNARWDEIKAFRCDPWNELELFKLMLSIPPAKQKTVSEIHTFDIGMVTQNLHFSNTDQEELNAYSFLRFCEEIGLPYRVGSYTVASKTALASLQHISQISPFWANATLVRLGDSKAVDSLFSRESVYRFTTKVADQLIQSYLDALNKCRDDIYAGDTFQNNSYGVRLAQLLPEVLSRLCCKCSIEKKYHILEFITELYASPGKSNYRNVKSLTKRLISSMSDIEQYNLVPDLLKIPFPEDSNLLVKDEFLNPLLLLELNQKPDCATSLEIQHGLINHLFREATLDNSDRRRWAITSLITLYKFQLLDSDQSSKLTEAIWCVVDQYGLPNGTDFYKFAFLHLPHPIDIDPSHLFKKYVRATQFPIQKNMQDGGVKITGGNIPVVQEIIGANSNGRSIWTREDAVEFLQRLLEWWDADKNKLRENDNAPAGIPSKHKEFRSRFTKILEIIAEVVAPKLRVDSSDDIKTSLDRLLNEMKEFNLPVLTAEAACLHIYPAKESDIFEQINDVLIINQVKDVRVGLIAIYKILIGSVASSNTSMARDLVFALSQYIMYCQTKSISQAMYLVVHILMDTPSHFYENLENASLKRLSHLLEETAYDNRNSNLLFEEKLEIRKYAVKLAGKLNSHFTSENKLLPDVLQKWHEASQSPNEFAEIRNAWKS